MSHGTRGILALTLWGSMKKEAAARRHHVRPDTSRQGAVPVANQRGGGREASQGPKVRRDVASERSACPSEMDRSAHGVMLGAVRALSSRARGE